MPIYKHKLNENTYTLETSKDNKYVSVLTPEGIRTQWVSVGKIAEVGPDAFVAQMVGSNGTDKDKDKKRESNNNNNNNNNSGTLSVPSLSLNLERQGSLLTTYVPPNSPIPMTLSWFMEAIDSTMKSIEDFEDLILSFKQTRFNAFLKELFATSQFASTKVEGPLFRKILQVDVSKDKKDFVSRGSYIKMVFLPNTNFHDIKVNDEESNGNIIEFPHSYIEKKYNNAFVKLNDQFRWTCLFFFVTSFASMDKEDLGKEPWNKFFKDDRHREAVGRKEDEDVIFEEYIKNIYYIIPKSYGIPEKRRSASYNNGDHIVDEDWLRFNMKANFASLLPIDRKKRIYEYSLETFRSSIMDYHYSHQYKFSDIFRTIYDGYTDRHWTVFEIATTCLIILTDILLSSEFKFEGKVDEDDRRIEKALQSVSLSERTWSSLKKTGVKLCRMNHFILHYHKNDDDGLSTLESIYWACLTIVKKGYYTMHKKYPSDYAHDESSDLLYKDSPLRLGKTTVPEAIMDIFGSRKGKQIVSLYVYLQNSRFKDKNNLNYEIWKRIPVDEVE